MKHIRIPTCLLMLLVLAVLSAGCGEKIPLTISHLYADADTANEPLPGGEISASVIPGTYGTAQTLYLSAEGQTIYYTTALIDPTPAMVAAYLQEGPSAAPYLTPYTDNGIQTTFRGKTEIRALAQNNQGDFSEVQTFAYTIVPEDDRIAWWEDPIIEAGIRAWLDRPMGDIYQHELDDITRIAVVGNSVLFNDEALQLYYDNFSDRLILHDEVYIAEAGSLSTLADIGNCLRLRELMIFYNGISTLRGVERLAPLTGLTGLQLRETRIADLGPIACLSNLQGLSIAHTPVRELSALRHLTKLESFSASFTKIDDLSPLADCGWLKTLLLTDAPVSDLSPLNALNQLEGLYINCLPVSLDTISATFPYLLSLFIDETQYSADVINGAFPALMDLGIYFEGKPTIDVREITKVNADCRVIYVYDATAFEINAEASFLKNFAGWSSHVHR